MTDLLPDLNKEKLEKLRQAVMDFPENGEANTALGLALARLRQSQQTAEPYLLKALSDTNLSEESRVTVCFCLGNIYSARADFQRALAFAELGHQLRPTTLDFRVMRIQCQFRLGLYKEASRNAAEVVAAQSTVAARYGQAYGRGPVHVLAPELQIQRYFGELAAKPDLYLKAQALGLIQQAETFLAITPHEVSNPALMDYWREHITVVEGGEALNRAVPGPVKPRFFLDFCPVPDGRTLHRDQAHRMVQKAWEAKGEGPLLSLRDDHRDQGYQRLKALGFAEGDWFVAWHVRDAATYNEGHAWSGNRFRNAETVAYEAAVRLILDQGGWVVRLGDPAMPRLSFEHPRLIDYAHGDDSLRADWMDLFLVAEARFYFGMASGPSSVAVNFGTPTLGTNWFHLGPWPYCTGDLFIPKRLVREKDGTPLSMTESLVPDLWGALEPPLFEASGITVEDNTSEEILAATEEMLARLDGSFVASAEDEARQKAFAKAADPLNLGMPARCGTDFLRRHPELCR
ncbi:MAG: TIGR04372 family glycosyltransferase [Magnetovibrionaceae bacterium]